MVYLYYLSQWGKYAESEGTSTYYSFPIAFPSACFSASSTPNINSAGASKDPGWIYIYDRTKFLIGCGNDNSCGSDTSKRVGMIAIGH